MTRQPQVPGLNDKWAEQQLALPVPGGPCMSCTSLDGRVTCGGSADRCPEGGQAGRSWATSERDVLADLRAAMDAVEAAPYRPDPPVCRHCAHVADTPGGPVFACQSAPGCLLDKLGPEQSR